MINGNLNHEFCLLRVVAALPDTIQLNFLKEDLCIGLRITMFVNEDSGKMSQEHAWTREKQPAKLPQLEMNLYYVLWSIPLTYSYYSIYRFSAGSIFYLSVLIRKKAHELQLPDSARLAA